MLCARKDAEKNQLVCPKCNSSRIKKGFDFKHGDQCPKCEAGVLMTESCECAMF